MDYLPYNNLGMGVAGGRRNIMLHEAKKLSFLVNQELLGGLLLLLIVVIVISRLLPSTTFHQQKICGKLRSSGMQRQIKTPLKMMENPIGY